MPINPYQGIFTFGIPQGNQITQNPAGQPAREEQTKLEGTSAAASSRHTMAARALHLQRTLSDSVRASEISRRNQHLEVYRHSLNLWVEHSPSVQRRVREETQKRIVRWQDADRAEAPLTLSAASLREEADIEEALTVMPPLPPGVQMADISGHRFLTLSQHNLPNTLRFLDASECNLQSLPIRLPASLEVLNIQNNRIESLPLRLPGSLIRLDASGGRGELIVPAGILVAASRAENPCEINLRGTRVSAASQRRIEAHNERIAQNGIGREIEIEQGAGNRENNINIYGVGRRSQTLGQAVQTWYNTHTSGRAVAWRNIHREALSKANAIPLDELDEADKAKLIDPAAPFWALLDSLNGTRDAQTDRSFRERVTTLLDAMESDEELRDTCFDIAHNAVETCHDNVTLGFNKMEQAHLTRRAARGDFTRQELFALGMSNFKLQMLDALAQKRAHEIGNDSEELEVVLYYRTKLANRLSLTHQSRDMLYERVAIRDENRNIVVNRSDLDKAAKAVQSAARDPQQMIEFLTEWEPWQQDLERRYSKNFNTAALEKRESELSEQMDELMDNSDLEEGDKLQRVKTLTDKFANLRRTFFHNEWERLTKEFVMSNAASKNCTIL